MCQELQKSVAAGVSFGIQCDCCKSKFIVTAEDVFNNVEFMCDTCHEHINLVEVCGAALAQFSDEDLEDIWAVAVRTKEDMPLNIHTGNGTIYD